MGNICHEVVVFLRQMIQMTQFSQERLLSIFEENLNAVFTIIMVMYIHVIVYGHGEIMKHIFFYFHFQHIKTKMITL